MEDSEYQGFERTTDSWNVAGGFVIMKILKPLVEVDKLVSVALYGAENIDSSLHLAPEEKTMARIEAIHRLIDMLKTIIENSYFAMKKFGTLAELEALELKVINVDNVVGAIAYTQTDMRTNTTSVVINESHFITCLNALREVKKNITKPLNSNGLIFPMSEEVDLESIKANIIDAG